MLTRSLRSAAVAAALVAALGHPAPVEAAGFALFEQGARGMGFAGAFTAQASDPSALFHNAAGIAFLRGRQIYVGGTMIAPSSSFQGADPIPGAAVVEKADMGLIPMPAVYYTQSLGGGLAAGVGLNVPFGLKSQWANPDAYSGRFIAQMAELQGFSINPTIAVKLADRFALGGGVDFRLSSITLERRVPLINPFTQRVVDAAGLRLESSRATGVGFNLGLLAKLLDSTSVGLAYRHRVKVDYEGTGTFTPLGTGDAQLDARVVAVLPQGALPVKTSVTFPAMVSAGVAHRSGDWTFEADVNWYQWSSFDVIRLEFLPRPDLTEVIVEDYRDSFQYRLGVERVIDDTWTARGGYFWDETPSPPASMSPLLPDADRHGFALGGSWVSGRLRVDGGTWFVLSPRRSTAGLNRDRFDGSYKNRAFTLGVSLGYAF